MDSGVDVFGGAGGRGHRQDARATLDKRTGIFGADLNGAKVGRSGMKGYAAFLQNAGLGRGGTQSDALGWYTVSRWDTGRRKDEGWTVGQTFSEVLAGEVTGRMPVPLWIRGQGSWGGTQSVALGWYTAFLQNADVWVWDHEGHEWTRMNSRTGGLCGEGGEF